MTHKSEIYRFKVWERERERNDSLKLVLWTQTKLVIGSLTHQSESNWLAMWVEQNDSHKLVT